MPSIVLAHETQVGITAAVAWSPEWLFAIKKNSEVHTSQANYQLSDSIAGSVGLKGVKAEPLTHHPLVVALLDPHDRAVAAVFVQTDEFGTASFVLPAPDRVGVFRVSVLDLTTFVRLEDPTFVYVRIPTDTESAFPARTPMQRNSAVEIKLQPPKENDNLTISRLLSSDSFVMLDERRSYVWQSARYEKSLPLCRSRDGPFDINSDCTIRNRHS